MKRLMVALLATSTMAFAVPAMAHPGDNFGGGWAANDWNNGGDGYAEFSAEYQHIWDGIQHGLSDGSYTPRQAQSYYRQMQQIRARADWMQRRGHYDPEDIQNRLERLHDSMHVAHDRGHDRQDGYGNYSGYYPYSNDHEYRR